MFTAISIGVLVGEIDAEAHAASRRTIMAQLNGMFMLAT